MNFGLFLHIQMLEYLLSLSRIPRVSNSRFVCNELFTIISKLHFVKNKKKHNHVKSRLWTCQKTVGWTGSCRGSGPKERIRCFIVEIWFIVQVVVWCVCSGPKTYIFIHSHGHTAESGQKRLFDWRQTREWWRPMRRDSHAPRSSAQKGRTTILWCPLSAYPPVKTFLWEWAWPTSSLI